MAPKDTSSMTLRERLAHVPQTGRLLWIGVRPAYGAPMIVLPEVELVEGRGAAGDRAAGSGRAGGKRQVTLVQHEHLPVVASLVGRDAVTPELVRRNLVVAGSRRPASPSAARPRRSSPWIPAAAPRAAASRSASCCRRRRRHSAATPGAYLDGVVG